LIDIFEHGHVNVFEYVEYNCEYWMIVGPLTLTVCVTLINEVYKRRMVNDEINKKRNNLVDILSWRSWCSSIEGGIEGNKLKFWRKTFDFCLGIWIGWLIFVTWKELMKEEFSWYIWKTRFPLYRRNEIRVKIDETLKVHMNHVLTYSCRQKNLQKIKIFCVTVFLSLESNYEIHFSRDICSLAILHVEHTEVWFVFLFDTYAFNHDII
jgi:hypothetical protein